ncbi:MAG: glycosyltransferase family 39 protein [Bacteroidaceae bacterium]|nr:glycosyltransferase family 39 protein [Bacteroidaceae bacterium]
MERKAIILLLAIVAFIPHNTALRPDIMECRNLVTAREIVQDGSWLVPTMNGALRLEKPPLPTWIAAAVESVCPDSLAMQRVPPALAAMLWLLFLYLIVKRLTDDTTAQVTALVFLTCYQVVLMGRTATWDVYCHAFMTGALFYLLRGLQRPADERAVWGDFAWAGLFMGLSFLSKGPVSFFALLLPFVIAAPLVSGVSLRGKWGALLLAVVLCIALGGWWYAYLYIAHPAELASVFHQETGAWADRNVRPWWYYWRFFLEAGVWHPFVLTALAYPLWRRRLAQPRAYTFFLALLVAQLVLLSLMPEKKYRYLLPLMPAMAALTALVLTHRHRAGSPWPRRLLLFTVGAAALIEVALLPLAGRIFGGDQLNSLALLQHDERAANLPLYHPATQELRIESVYAAHRRIAPLDVADSASLRRALPCIVLVHPGDTATRALLARAARPTPLGLYDDNHHPPTDKHHNPTMVWEAVRVETGE